MTGSAEGTNGRSEPRGARGRFSSRRKAEAVLRLLHGEELDALSRELGVTGATLAQWRERFLAAGQASLKSRPADDRDDEVPPPAGQGRRDHDGQRAAARARAHSGGRTPLWRAGGRGDEPGQLALRSRPLRHGPRLPGVGGSPLDGLRAAGSGQPHRATCGEARTEAGMDGRGADRADSLGARRLAVHRRGLPQGLGAAAPGRRTHVEGPGAAADAGGGPARPDPGRAPPRAAQPRRHDHHRAPRRNVGDRRDCLPHHPRGQRYRLHRRRPLHTGVRRHPRGAPPARASRRWSRCARGCGNTSAATGRASPRGLRCATTTAAST